MAEGGLSVSLRAVIYAVRTHKYVSLGTVAAFVCLMMIYLHLSSPSYPVAMQVAPASNGGQQLSGGLGALAKIGGINLPDASGGAMQFQLFRRGLTTRDAGEAVARDRALMREMFPGEWSEKQGRWVEPPSTLRSVANAVRWAVGIPVRSWSPPDGARVAEYLSNNLIVYEDADSPVITLQIQSETPQVSQHLLRVLTQAVDSQLRQSAQRRATDYVAYLTSELQKETISSYREAMIAHLAEQQQVLMMANASVSFAFQVFSEPSYPPKPTAPKGAILLVMAIVFGLLAGVILACWVEYQPRLWFSQVAPQTGISPARARHEEQEG